ncbi:phosphopantetheinyl transferase [Streptomyces tateyamensis]|uniref:Phosphopantetheinyl transferase n=1 Tax=Streptomyces tateyamensis TaxID=565073 RepID=A0A2V4NRB6_9ACTN|nr:4'-phosphopantetheinyl transferase superfamily protein [Streptomyces tateyamensis]PYC78550.1 phosphopantetheinyl transferase [Streptomyces tateyamensis]
MAGGTLPELPPVIPEARLIRHRDDDWSPVVADLATQGTVLIHARLPHWRPPEPEGPELRRLLGRDWSKYLDIAHEQLRDRFAATRLLLKYAAGKSLGAGDPADVELSYGPTGRPYLRGCDQVDVSLSHTDDLLLVGLTTRGLIGVDAERADRQLYAKGMGRHVCTQDEMRLLAEEVGRGRDANQALLRLWTLKEAYSKAIAQGMAFRFTEFGFGPDDRPVQVNRPDGTPGTGQEWGFRTFGLDEYVVSAAVYDAGFGRLRHTDFDNMLDEEAVAAIAEELARQRS